MNHSLLLRHPAMRPEGQRKKYEQTADTVWRMEWLGIRSLVCCDTKFLLIALLQLGCSPYEISPPVAIG